MFTEIRRNLGDEWWQLENGSKQEENGYIQMKFKGNINKFEDSL